MSSRYDRRCTSRTQVCTLELMQEPGRTFRWRARSQPSRSLRAIVVISLALLAMAVLVWFFPARWAAPLLQSRLHVRLQQVSGVLWDGTAGVVLTSDGRPLGRLRWQLSRRALRGDVRLHVQMDGQTLHFDGTLQRVDADHVRWRKVHLNIVLDALQPPLATPFGWPQGTLDLQVPSVLLQANWPMQLVANGHWEHAGLLTPLQHAILGNLDFSTYADRGTPVTRFHDDGNGPLSARGEWELSPLGWRLTATLAPRRNDPVLRRWLRSLGQPDAQGVVYVQRRGGLATVLPAHASSTGVSQ